MHVVSETFRANIIVSQAKLPYNGLHILKLDTKNMGHTIQTITHTHRGKSTSKTFILYKSQSILHVKMLFYNFSAHSTGFKNRNTLLVRKLTMFSPSKCLSSSKMKLPEKIFGLTQKKLNDLLKYVFPTKK